VTEPELAPDGDNEALADDSAGCASRTLRWVDLFGYDPDITGGLSVEDYLESSRGEA
jgi:hypothetical protein